MATAGYSGTPLAKKLGIKEGMTVALIGAPDHFVALLDPIPDAVQFKHSLRGKCDVAIAFFDRESALKKRLPALAKAIFPNGGLWLAWPKKSSSIETDLSGGSIRQQGQAAGLVDVKVCAIDNDWSGHRFCYRLKERG